MVEVDVDCNSNTQKKLTNKKKEEWDRLVLQLGLEDVWFGDDFIHCHSLLFSWNNKQAGIAHCKAGLYRFYVGDWGRERGGKTEVLDGRNTLFDHLSVTLLLCCQCPLADQDRIFKFNTTFLQEPKIIQKLQDHWNASTQPLPSRRGWQKWVAVALTRMKVFCQQTGK